MARYADYLLTDEAAIVYAVMEEGMDDLSVLVGDLIAPSASPREALLLMADILLENAESIDVLIDTHYDGSPA